ncbi:hypothetical protein LTR62_007378 [Meristemomyces frigidus]|uniref:mRNA stability protein n=1 Tax=Meristemomyces frigidus TaxID=1508187 RepID=A0AAN7YT70_9PEZI|nr:hypothetical protein LTR62_007378 [Meristemomyces frigidus]
MALNPHQKNKLDISQLSEEEAKLFRLYGKLPNRKDLLQNKLKERKYFDSGDYAMSKAGKDDVGLVGGVGREHPSPDSIPHLSTQNSASTPGSSGSGVPIAPSLHPTPSSHQGQATSGSPVKEPSVLQRGMSVDEQEPEEVAGKVERGVEGAKGKGVPIRQ